MKKALILLALMVLAIPSFCAMLLINGHKTEFSDIDVKEDNTVFVPLRDLEKAGFGVISPSDNGAVEFSTKSLNFLFYKNSDSVKMNALSLSLPKSTYVKEGKFMVPLSFIVKSLGGSYDQYEELVITCDNLNLVTKQTAKPALKKSETKAPATSESANTEEAKPETNTDSSKAEVIPAQAETQKKTITEYNKENLNINWFQGTVVAYGKKLNLIDLDLYDANSGKCIQTVKSNEGVFAFRNMPNGTYFIKVDHAKNPSFKSLKTEKFAVKNMEGNKMKKPLNLMRAIKSNGIKTVQSNGQTYYNLTWSPVPNVKNYKVIVSCANPKAKMPKYDRKTEKISISENELSKGQTYGIKVYATDSKGNKIGEYADSGWTFSTP